MEPTVQSQQTKPCKYKLTSKNAARVVLSIVLLFSFVGYNLATSALYYAERTPHKEGVDPAMIELFENPGWVHDPSMNEYQFDFDGAPAIIVNNDKGSNRGFITLKNDSEFPYYLFADFRTDFMYRFDKGYNLVGVYDGKIVDEYKDLSGFDESAIKQELRSLYQPLIDAQLAPLINLQFLYDHINHDRFN